MSVAKIFKSLFFVSTMESFIDLLERFFLRARKSRDAHEKNHRHTLSFALERWLRQFIAKLLH